MKITLASASPRRIELIKKIPFLEVSVHPSDIPEHTDKTDPSEAVTDLAEQKARAVSAAGVDGLILAADTMVVAGGETRTDSVMAGLAAVSDCTQLVAVHDGARPLVTDAVICRAVSKAKKFGAAAPAVRVKDTIKVSTDGAVEETPDRSKLYAVQTPQVFDRDLLAAALQNAKEQEIAITDDCSAVEALGMPVQLTDGDEENLKITTPFDLELAALILRRRANA